MNKQVNPLVSVVLIALALVAVWYAYTQMFTNKQTGSIGPPAGAAGPPPPGMPKGPPPPPPGSPEWKKLQQQKGAKAPAKG